MIAGTAFDGLDMLIRFTMAGVRPLVMLALLPPMAGAVLPWAARLAIVSALAVFTAFGPHAPATLGLEALPGEVLAGLLAGLAVAVAFAAAALAGEVAASIIGLGFASFATAVGNVSVIGNFFTMIVTLAWLTTDGHLSFLGSMVLGGGVLPPGSVELASVGLGELAAYGAVMFEGALRMALPVVGLLLVGNLVVALAVRAAPQLGALAIGPPLLLLLMVWTLPLLLEGLVSRARITLEAAGALLPGVLS
ncbi:flagellar biosynthetic protein FliR [Polymorphobacter sp.]|uniref:flagellar biosynthetic protein FliR n=1 Tax=Polymorphobacter sp. TaxID=1909290 RepID=UPI003F6FC43F